jgi:PiT family inorganic phosphate transporter
MPSLEVAFGLFLLSVTLSYAYAFIGGFTDAANAIATAVSTRAFSPLQAVLLAGLFELLGALTGTAVALTIGRGIVSPEVLTQSSVCAALLATMSWSLFTFWKGIPISETHGLVGGIVGAGVAAGGVGVVEWSSLGPVLAAIIISPLLGFVGAATFLTIIYHAFARVERARTYRLFLNLQRLSALFMAFSHGRNDAQKPMGVLTLALASYLGWQTLQVPLWVIVSVALVAALGVATGGWRIIRTLGMRLTGLTSVQGFAAEASAASVLQLASALAIPVSTTHAITSAIVGAGTVHGHKHVRWRVVGEITLSWVLTLPVTVVLGYGFAWSLVGLLGAAGE